MSHLWKYIGNLFEIIVVGLLAAIIAAVFVFGVIAPNLFDYEKNMVRNNFPAHDQKLCMNVPQGNVSLDLTNIPPQPKNGKKESKGNICTQADWSLPATGCSFEKEAKVFEAYGRLVTTIATLMTVLGVFFVYFSRKSHRELEQEIQSKLDAKVNEFKSFTEAAQVDLDKGNELKKECEKLKNNCEDLFSRLNEFIKKSDQLEKNNGVSALDRDVKNVDTALAEED
jgi:hypothetical protein